MSALVVGHIRVRDASAFARYREQVPATLEPWGGEVVVRGGNGELIDGEGSAEGAEDVVVLRFPSREAALGWHGSDAYQALIPQRRAGADVTLRVYDAP